MLNVLKKIWPWWCLSIVLRSDHNTPKRLYYSPAAGALKRRVRIIKPPKFRMGWVLWAAPIVSWMQRSYCLGIYVERRYWKAWCRNDRDPYLYIHRLYIGGGNPRIEIRAVSSPSNEVLYSSAAADTLVQYFIYLISGLFRDVNGNQFFAVKLTFDLSASQVLKFEHGTGVLGTTLITLNISVV